MSTLTFIGKTSATENEQSALDFLGRLIGAQEHELIVNPKGDSNKAIIAGYRAKQRTPTEVTKGVLDQPTDQLIVFADDALIDALTKQYPDWRDRKPAVMTSDKDLYTFLDAALAFHKERTGEIVEPFDRPE